MLTLLRMALSSGMRLGSYEIVPAIGSGGMGEGYLARDSKLRREVAIKVLPHSLANDEEALARFERQARALAGLSQPNMLAMHDCGHHDGIAYAVTELLTGTTLYDKLEAGLIPLQQTMDMALQISRGLAAAHEKGIVHRDLKPDSLFITK